MTHIRNCGRARWILKVVWKLSCTQELQIKTSSASIEPLIGSTIQSLRLKIVLVILLVLSPSGRTYPKLLTEPANKKKTTSKCRIVCQTHFFEVPPVPCTFWGHISSMHFAPEHWMFQFLGHCHFCSYCSYSWNPCNKVFSFAVFSWTVYSHNYFYICLWKK